MLDVPRASRAEPPRPRATLDARPRSRTRLARAPRGRPRVAGRAAAVRVARRRTSARRGRRLASERTSRRASGSSSSGTARASFYVVLEGTRRGARSTASASRELGAGDFFGELAALDWGAGFGYPRLATVIAATPLALLVFPTARSNELIAPIPGARRPSSARSPSRDCSVHERARSAQSLRVLAVGLPQPRAARVEIAFVAFNGAEWAVWIAMLVYAYDRAARPTAGLVALIQLVPAALFAPLASVARRPLSPGARARRSATSSRPRRWAQRRRRCSPAAPPLLAYALAAAAATAVTVTRPDAGGARCRRSPARRRS